MEKYFHISALAITLLSPLIIFAPGGNSALIFRKYEDLLQALDYDAPCNPEVELLRQDYVRPVITGEINYLAKPKTDLRRMEYVSTIERLQQPLCNALKLLICNTTTNRCDCGSPSKQALFPGREEASQGFIVEDGVCRWAKGGYCQTEVEYLPKKASQWCEKGMLCMLAGNTWGPCSNNEILKYAVQSNLTSTKALNEALYSGKICSCKRTALSWAVDRTIQRKGWMG